MKKSFIVFFASFISLLPILGTTVDSLERNCAFKYNSLLSRQQNYERKLQGLQRAKAGIEKRLDSLDIAVEGIAKAQEADRNSLGSQIKKNSASLVSSQSVIAHRTMWGIVLAMTVILLLVVAIIIVLRRIKRGDNSIETTIGEVRKAQDSLQAAQTKLQENSIQLDNKLLEIVQRQMDAEREKPTTPYTAPDHSLVLKVADEIVKIELNMSRMDSTVKGYKQLKKAVERIKDNFKANGYEFVEMLGMPYNEGMKVTASFVSDESLEPGKQIISGITKPQINYNGRMIQAAQITVSQNI